MKSMPETRHTLIGKLKNPQDVEAWEEFVDTYQPIIFRLCKAKGLQHADANDVTQEILARIASAIDRFDPSRKDATFRGWLFRISQNSVVDFFRRQKKKPNRPGSLAAIGDRKISNLDDSALFQKEFEKQLFVLVAKQIRQQINNATWVAFRETEIEQRPVSDVARELGMTVGAVYVARSRVIARFKKKIAERMQSDCSKLGGT